MASTGSSRKTLRRKAKVWRQLMGIGMYLHSLPSPWPENPTFTRRVRVGAPFTPGEFLLHFYTHPSYKTRSASKRYPVIVNFHGGGFTIGSGTDDARWVYVAMEQLEPIVVSVEYRLAPEYPYPVGMQDGVAALHYLEQHDVELGLDLSKVITCGFSAGGNYCFTVPMLYNSGLLLSDGPRSGKISPRSRARRESRAASSVDRTNLLEEEENVTSAESSLPTLTRATTSYGVRQRRPEIYRAMSDQEFPRIAASTSATHKASKQDFSVDTIHHPSGPLKCNIIAIAAFYPAVDFSKGRPHRRSTNPNPAHELPHYLTDLFDASFLYPSDLDLTDPYLSPLCAPDELLLDDLPDDIMIHTCEWDGLAQEGRDFAERLTGLGKRVFHRQIAEVPHAWDRHPALHIPPSVRSCYMEVCARLKGILAEKEGEVKGLMELSEDEGRRGLSIVEKEATLRDLGIEVDGDEEGTRTSRLDSQAVVA